MRHKRKKNNKQKLRFWKFFTAWLLPRSFRWKAIAWSGTTRSPCGRSLHPRCTHLQGTRQRSFTLHHRRREATQRRGTTLRLPVIWLQTRHAVGVVGDFSVLTRARTKNHLNVLEAVYISVLNPVICKQKSFVTSLALFQRTQRTHPP